MRAPGISSPLNINLIKMEQADTMKSVFPTQSIFSKATVHGLFVYLGFRQNINTPNTSPEMGRLR